jgi:pimeloyl-ACP methyl ester carboxylesterase
VANRLNHHRRGSGPPLVLVHGVGHHWQTWRPVIDLLAEEFEIFACDVPGFGASPPLPAGVPRTIASFADAMQAFCDERGLGRPHVAGNSMGGGIALELARRRAVRSATAFSPVGFATPLERDFATASLAAIVRIPHALRPAALALVRTRVRRLLFGQLFGYPVRLPVQEGADSLRDVWSAPSFLEALRALRDHELAEAQQLRGVPLTIAWGRHDRLLLYRQAARARARLPWAVHVTLGAGHIPFFDDPGACAQVIRSCAGRARGHDDPSDAADGSPAACCYAPSSAS